MPKLTEYKNWSYHFIFRYRRRFKATNFIHKIDFEYLQSQENKGNFDFIEIKQGGVKMSQNIAVVLSGCGVFDGAEINEVVLTLLHLEKNDASYQCFAPDQAQHHVVNHITGEEMPESRNVLIESARIVRGNIKPLSECVANDFDALIIPGGFGVAKNLSDFAFNGTNMTVNSQLLNLAKDFKDAHKPAGYMCIAPALCSHIYGEGVKATIGTDEDTASALNAMGAQHCSVQVGDIVIDEQHKLVTTPAYMLAENIVQAESGIARLVSEVLKLV